MNASLLQKVLVGGISDFAWEDSGKSDGQAKM